jgi:hypothetical protein
VATTTAISGRGVTASTNEAATGSAPGVSDRPGIEGPLGAARAESEASQTPLGDYGDSAHCCPRRGLSFRERATVHGISRMSDRILRNPADDAQTRTPILRCSPSRWWRGRNAGSPTSGLVTALRLIPLLPDRVRSLSPRLPCFRWSARSCPFSQITTAGRARAVDD